MTGFQITLRDKAVSASIENDGVTCVIITNNRKENTDTINLDVTGLDSANGQHTVWLREALQSGDEISIKVKDIPSSSPPIEVMDGNSSGVNSDEVKLEKYKALGEELKKKGLI